MLRDYSYNNAFMGTLGIENDTDELEPLDPSVFFGAEDEEELEDDGIDSDDDDDEIEDEEDEEY